MTGAGKPPVRVGNILRDLPNASREEVTQILAEGQDVRIERIVSHGQESAPGFWYEQDEHEWVLLMTGSAGLELQDPDERLALHPGEHLLIPAGRKHRVAWTAPDTDTIWLAVFYRA